jgi:hypothetical protein
MIDIQYRRENQILICYHNFAIRSMKIYIFLDFYLR